MTTQEPAAPSSSSAARTRAYRARLKAAGRTDADTPPCRECGRLILLGRIQPGSPRDRSELGKVLCAPCWRASPDGLAAERIRDRQRKGLYPEGQGRD